ncbi:AVT3-involved in amino acid efflux from the vacuole [Fusarium agapanthi]|uniref:AVT3-involved in amino acid efflux from the vacuole n=1 Tax=Fusarium agapanthi TaxID=1803897 RepID=A0A9P5E3J9_9HYPO|nr:AVT3-involved in amino acid efflux from the vacuole [Fusarium agapanthi]
MAEFANFDGTPSSLGSETGKRKAAILDRHLPDGYSAEPDVAFGPANPSASGSASNDNNDISGDPVESSLLLQGGDMHRDMFKIKARANSLRRAATFSHHTLPPLAAEDELSHSEQREPGGFRRYHLQRRARQRRMSGYTIVAKNFVDFLDLYGSFAGEDLEDVDSEDESAIDDREDGDVEQPPELRPLLGRRRSSKRMRKTGDATTTKTFFTLIKAFIGTGIMFLPKAFRNGGILFSSITLIVLSLVNCGCFRLLLDCRQIYGGGYGELGEAIVGPRFRSLVLASITVSQLGFVCAGLIFTAENLYAFLDAVTANHRELMFSVPSLIALQLVALVPLALIRNISKLGPAALLADVFILIGIVYIWYYDIAALSQRGMDSTVKLFNPRDFTLTIGSGIFTFEGIGLILPIQSSMKRPEHFPNLLYLVMFIITIIFTSVGALCYATFGENTKIQVISNFPQDSPLVNAVQFLYSIAVLAGDPVQLFPAARIIETSVFGERATGKKSAAIKWKKNALRTLLVGVCVGVSIVGASDLDKFVALIGSFACVPLVYIYPAYLHYKGAAQTTRAKVIDIVVMVVGFIAMVYTTLVTVYQWIDSA